MRERPFPEFPIKNIFFTQVNQSPAFCGVLWQGGDLRSLASNADGAEVHYIGDALPL